MDSTIKFPDWRRMNPRREIRESATPAPVVFDFGAIHEQNTRRQKFHEIMGHIDGYSADETPPRVETREDMNLLFLHKMVEALKEVRYELDLDVIMALNYISMVVSMALIEVEPQTFVIPDYSEYKDAVSPDVEIILTYAFSDLPMGDPVLDGMKTSAILFFKSTSLKTEEIYGAPDLEREKREAIIAQIFPFVMDALRQYAQYFRSKEQLERRGNIVPL